MTVEQLPGYLREHWPEIRESLLDGSYRPQPVLRKEIPKPGGGVRELGIPTVLDRLIQQALAQVLQAEWDRYFSRFSFGFRPKRSAHQAVACAQQFLREGYAWVVDLDVEKFFDRVVHEVLMSRVKRRIADPRVLKLIDRYLKSGVMIGEMLEPTEEGVPQGGPLSPLLANLLLDDLDRELEKRGLHFVRYADDVNIYVRMGIPSESGHPFRGEGGHPSDVKAATHSEAKAATDSDGKAATFCGSSEGWPACCRKER